MIPISKGDIVPGPEKLVVVSDGGDYADTDLILCASPEEPGTPIAQYQAQYIRYGDMVYQHATPEELGAAIVALEPGSTHDAAQLWREDEARRVARAGGTLAPENPTPAPDAVEPEETETVITDVEKEPEPRVQTEPELPVIESFPETPEVESVAEVVPEAVIVEPVIESVPETIPEIIVPEPTVEVPVTESVSTP